MSIKSDNESMARLYTESVDVHALVPKQGVDTLDEYLNGLVGTSIREVLDKESYLSLYMMNKHGIRGATSGDDKDLRDFSDAVGRFVNRKISEVRPAEREYYTPEFKEKHNYAEYEEIDKQERSINPFKARKEAGGDMEAYNKALAQRKALRQAKSETEYGRALTARDRQYDQEVKDYHNTPMTKEYLSDDGSAEYKKLEHVFNRLVGGQSATSEYDDNNVVDV